MIRVNYIIPAYVDVIFDDIFRYEGYREINSSLSEVVDFAKELMKKYGFKTAVVVEVDTSEIFAEIKDDDNDDDNGYDGPFDD